MLKTSTSCPSEMRRRGAVAIWGMVCLILATIIAAILGKLALTGGRAIVQDHRYAQCEWLGQSAWSLAQARLSENPDYTGETWDIPAEQFGGADVGQVIIEVIAPDPVTNKVERQVRMIARFPKDSPRQVKLTSSKTWKAK